MNLSDRINEAKKKAKKSSSNYFKPKPKKVDEALKKETVLGHPKNLIKPDNKEE